MYNYIDTGNGIISVIFFVLVVLIGAFFTMNLVLAIIVDSFDAIDQANADEVEDEEEKAVSKIISDSPVKSPVNDEEVELKRIETN